LERPKSNKSICEICAKYPKSRVAIAWRTKEKTLILRGCYKYYERRKNTIRAEDKKEKA